MLKFMGKKILQFYAQTFCLSKPVNKACEQLFSFPGSILVIPKMHDFIEMRNQLNKAIIKNYTNDVETKIRLQIRQENSIQVSNFSTKLYVVGTKKNHFYMVFFCTPTIF